MTTSTDLESHIVYATDDIVRPTEPTRVRRPSNSFDDHPFMWLNTWLMYFPMWTCTMIKNDKMIPRNKHAAKYGYYTVLLFNIIFFVWDVFWWIYRPGLCLFSFVFFVSICLTTASRGICIYYFFHHFRYYGLSHETKAAKEDTPHDQHHKLMHKTNIRFRLILVFVILASIIDAIISVNQTSKMVPENNIALKSMMIWQTIFNFVYIYFYTVPLFLVQFVLSIYYVRACIFVKEFTEMIDINNGDVDLNAAIQEYSTYRIVFRNKIVWLERIMLLRLSSQIFWIWVDITWLMEVPQWYEAFTPLIWIIITILPFFEMVMSANDATKKFHGLHKKLYQIGTEKDYFGELSLEEGISRTRYLFLLEYISTYPFMIKILAREISFKNAARVSAAFIIAKTITYLFKMNVI
eukprot:273407_1